jgi:hypothetical protein
LSVFSESQFDFLVFLGWMRLRPLGGGDGFVGVGHGHHWELEEVVPMLALVVALAQIFDGCVRGEELSAPATPAHEP